MGNLICRTWSVNRQRRSSLATHKETNTDLWIIETIGCCWFFTVIWGDYRAENICRSCGSTNMSYWHWTSEYVL